MSTENKPESPKEGEEKNWLYEQYNLTHEQTKDSEISLLYDKWNEATEELQSLRDQLAAKEEENRKLWAAFKRTDTDCSNGVMITDMEERKVTMSKLPK